MKEYDCYHHFITISLNWRNILIICSPWRYMSSQFSLSSWCRIALCWWMLVPGYTKCCPKEFSPKWLQCLRAPGKPKFGGEVLAHCLFWRMFSFPGITWEQSGAGPSWLAVLTWWDHHTSHLAQSWQRLCSPSPLPAGHCQAADAPGWRQNPLSVCLQEPQSQGTSSQPAGDSSAATEQACWEPEYMALPVLWF